ncbi:uncharacterized protein BDZ99DRAFT_575595 [Mytilinidion resinicola]|uniref:RING-type domain-containing protein n=1 Tax=Mytilinidion resinicola TaxID=574789 RepID=A0A6A6Y5L9_9PEZI|nr:uncharacterized protein BDZ99DRAFT_575595 [Mytilinidion resinicola]KAF2803919.1 hypothetical protein BDZ99DRAFT_575595 [Mytilinidion resinicola]
MSNPVHRAQTTTAGASRQGRTSTSNKPTADKTDTPSGNRSQPVSIDSDEEMELSDDGNYSAGEDADFDDADFDDNYFGGEVSTANISSEDSQSKCYICKKEYDHPHGLPQERDVNHRPFMLLNCGHVFGHFCLNELYQDTKKFGQPQCPKCRVPVGDDDIEKLAH